MMTGWFARFGRMLSLVLLAALGASILMRYAPGYFVDGQELDAAHASEARAHVHRLEAAERSLPRLLASQCRGWLHGDLGRSRHYENSVSELLRERYSPTLRLISAGLALGWGLAFLSAAVLSSRYGSRSQVYVSLATATALAVPVGVMATFSQLANKGGPVATLAVLVAVREFKLLYGLFREARRKPHLFYARAQGFSATQSFRVHTLSLLKPELWNMLGMSVVVALSALVPVEVIFDVPGLGQLAWSAATNRDLPVLVAMTALMALCVGVVSLLVTPIPRDGAPVCE